MVQDDSTMTVLQCRRLHQKKDPPPALVRPADLDNILYSDLHCAAAGTACAGVSCPERQGLPRYPMGAVVVTRPCVRPYRNFSTGC